MRSMKEDNSETHLKVKDIMKKDHIGFLKSFSQLRETVPAFYHYKNRNQPYMDFLHESSIKPKQNALRRNRSMEDITIVPKSKTQKAFDIYIKNSK
mmetsp:Transcript_20088/g.17787  ORF Transcript_20088/g.17787 Transcript_20088/m.17787 type:complete len:96 (+) Transcript_20088:220-507(+)